MGKNSSFDSAAKRSKLPSAKNPYWQGIAGGRGGVSLGYRKPTRGPGVWIAKMVLDGNRREERIAHADDYGAVEGALPYTAAIGAVMEWARGQLTRIESRQDETAPEQPLTVVTALKAYVTAHEARKASLRSYMGGTFRRHVYPDTAFSSMPIAALTAEAIVAWRDRIEPQLSKRSVNRILTEVRAALNHAANLHRRVLPAGLPTEIKIGTKAIPGDTNARKQVLPDTEIQRLIESAFAIDETGDFGRIILVMAATGARFSQLARITVADVQVSRCRIMVPPSRKGRAGKAPILIAVPVGADVIARLQPILFGRRGPEPLLLYWLKKQIGPVESARVDQRGWSEAASAARDWRKAKAHAEVPATTVMLCFRHSSIVRALIANVPVRLVAARHDTSVATIEAHYSAYIVDATGEIERRAVTSLMPIGVLPLRAKDGAAA